MVTIAPRPVAIVVVTMVTVFAGQVLLTSAADAPTILSSIALGSAATYSALGGSIGNTGSSLLNGDLGASPGVSIGGFPPGTYEGAAHAGDPLAVRARSDFMLAYATAAGRTPTRSFTGDQNGKRFDSGTYRTGTAFSLTGTMTLNGQNNPSALFIFQVEAGLNTAAGSTLSLINGARAANVYWQVDGAAGTGARSSFAGTILAKGNITLGVGASLDGRALASGQVTLADDAVTTPFVPPTTVISLPASGHTYLQGQAVATHFTCGDPTGPGVVACTDTNGSVSPGALTTRAAGSFSYTATVVSADGRRGTARVRYKVAPRRVRPARAPRFP